MTETLTSPLAAMLEAVPADWGHYDCQRLATPAEMVEAEFACAECGEALAAKVGGGLVQGTVLGYRFGPDQMWVWTKPMCHGCEVKAAIADGY